MFLRKEKRQNRRSIPLTHQHLSTKGSEFTWSLKAHLFLPKWNTSGIAFYLWLVFRSKGVTKYDSRVLQQNVQKCKAGLASFQINSDNRGWRIYHILSLPKGGNQYLTLPSKNPKTRETRRTHKKPNAALIWVDTIRDTQRGKARALGIEDDRSFETEGNLT